jgi:selenocysteine-specific elongation factor
MKTFRFEASLAPENRKGPLPARTVILVQGSKVPATLRPFTSGAQEEKGPFFVHVQTRRSLSLKWGDAFEVLDAANMERVGRGVVLNPFLREKGRPSAAAGLEFLRDLSGSDKDMLAALCRKKGIKGLSEEEAHEFSGLSGERIQVLGEELEKAGKVKMISFSPLFCIARESFDFLCARITAFLEQILKNHPAQRGVALERIRKRFGLTEKVLALAVRALEKTGEVRQVGRRLAPARHEVFLSPQEEKLLQRLEDMSFKGEFQSASFGEIQREFHLSSERLEDLLSLLVERRKIIPGPEGLYVHARWLEEVIGQVRTLGKKEMTVSDFKALTGLSRKYAIPLLELLDQMGVTRRKGPVREIL